MKYLNRLSTSRKDVEAIQYTLNNLNDIIGFVGSEKVHWNCLSEELWIETHAGYMLVRKGAYVVKRQQVGVYPLAPNLFQKLYKKVEVDVCIDPIETTCKETLETRR